MKTMLPIRSFALLWLAGFVMACNSPKTAEQATAPEVPQEPTTLKADTAATVAGTLPAKPSLSFVLDDVLAFDSEAALKAVYGENVQRSVGYLPEGMGEYAITVLYAGTPNELELAWGDDTITFSGLQYINITGEQSDWRTALGVGLGTDLKTLEQLNGKPFSFYGFGWDYGGAIDWEGGKLAATGLVCSFASPQAVDGPKYISLLGDHKIPSSNPLAQQLNPWVYTLKMTR